VSPAARPLANFICVESPEIIHKVVGESERAITEIFRAARRTSPCILFFDHIEVRPSPLIWRPSRV
jgi:transitional endoplasmic reticulum ATPase